MVAKGGAKLIRDDAREMLIELLIPLALVVTPNIPEAEALTGLSISGTESMREGAVGILELGDGKGVGEGGEGGVVRQVLGAFVGGRGLHAGDDGARECVDVAACVIGDMRSESEDQVPGNGVADGPRHAGPSIR